MKVINKGKIKNKSANLPAIEKPGKVFVNESEIAARARARKAKTVPLEDAIKQVVINVDAKFPSAYDPHLSLQNILGDDPGEQPIAEAFLTLNQLAHIERSMKFDDVWLEAFPEHRADLENSVIQYGIAQEILPLVIGYAAGMRTAGYSRDETVMTLRSFLRNVHDDEGEIR